MYFVKKLIFSCARRGSHINCFFFNPYRVWWLCFGMSGRNVLKIGFFMIWYSSKYFKNSSCQICSVVLQCRGCYNVVFVIFRLFQRTDHQCFCQQQARDVFPAKRQLQEPRRWSCLFLVQFLCFTKTCLFLKNKHGLWLR